MNNLSFKNDPKIKKFYIDRALAHQKADEIIQGEYWKNGKGCCIGCLAHDNEDAHRKLSEKTDVPQWIYTTADKIHEGLSLEDAKKWPAQFVKALPVGKDLNELLYPWLIIVVESVLDKFDHSKNPRLAKSIMNVLDKLKKGVTDIDELNDADYAAPYADYAASCAVDAAAYADYADYAANRAAYAAAYTAYAAAAAPYAANAAKEKAWLYFRDQFVKLLKGAK